MPNDDCIDTIQARVDAAIVRPEKYVLFSAYGVHRHRADDERYYDNLDVVAHYGRIRFVMTDGGYWGNGGTYRSAIEENPTWLRLAVLANDMIVATGDRHHVFLEGISITEDCGDVAIAEFAMGS